MAGRWLDCERERERVKERKGVTKRYKEGERERERAEEETAEPRGSLG